MFNQLNMILFTLASSLWTIKGYLLIILMNPILSNKAFILFFDKRNFRVRQFEWDKNMVLLDRLWLIQSKYLKLSFQKFCIKKSRKKSAHWISAFLSPIQKVTKKIICHEYRITQRRNKLFCDWLLIMTIKTLFCW